MGINISTGITSNVFFMGIFEQQEKAINKILAENIGMANDINIKLAIVGKMLRQKQNTNLMKSLSLWR